VLTACPGSVNLCAARQLTSALPGSAAGKPLQPAERHRRQAARGRGTAETSTLTARSASGYRSATPGIGARTGAEFAPLAGLFSRWRWPQDAAEIAVFERVAVSFEVYYGIAGDLRRAAAARSLAG